MSKLPSTALTRYSWQDSVLSAKLKILSSAGTMYALPIAFSYSIPAAQDMEDQTVMVWCIHQCSIDQPLVLLQLCFSTVFGSYILSKWRHLYSTKYLCVLSWMEWCQVYNRYFHPLGVTVIDCYIEQHTKHCLKSFRNEKYLVSSNWNLTVYKTYIPMRYQHCLPIVTTNAWMQSFL